jgi:hypothetical protein
MEQWEMAANMVNEMLQNNYEEASLPSPTIVQTHYTAVMYVYV